MTREDFTSTYFPLAKKAGERFNMDPAIILAQASIESAWGSSYGARQRHNFFGITAGGSPNPYWNGSYSVSLSNPHIRFRIYKNAQDSFYDFARLISSKYSAAHALSFDAKRYAQAIAYSPYITEKNGDNRAAYMLAIQQNFDRIAAILKKKELS
jgi:flagellar protein FlgJ